MDIKNFITIPTFALILACLLSPIQAIADNKTAYTISMQRNSKEQPEHNMDLDEEGRRMPARPVCCTISNTDGVSISGCEDEIITYELWDIDGENCIATSVDEMDFLAVLYSLTGEYTIKLTTFNYIYIGYISTISL